MLRQLKEWILAGISKRAPRRRGSVPRSRGQIEQLESRTVLSATIDVVAINLVAVDFEAHTVTVIAVLESRPLVPHIAISAFNQFGDAPWETLPLRNRFGNPWLGYGSDGRNDFRPPIALLGGGATPGSGLNSGATEFSETGPTGVNGAADDKPPQYAYADPSAPLGSFGVSTNSVVPPSSNVFGQGAFMDRSLRDTTGSVASYISSLSTLSASSASGLTTSRLSIHTYDVAFGEFTPNSQLLAADLDSQNGVDVEDELDDKLDSDEELADDLSDSEKSLDDDVSASLDALRRERRAIDAVLAELFELRLHADTLSPATPPKAAPQRSGTKAESNERESWAIERAIPGTPVAVDQAEGGMVLLEPSGDANSSAYDLAAVYLQELDGSTSVPLGVETSVGMFQAIDVGKRELQPASRENLPIAQPAAARPSVSAENAPAKKSDQPS